MCAHGHVHKHTHSNCSLGLSTLQELKGLWTHKTTLRGTPAPRLLPALQESEFFPPFDFPFPFLWSSFCPLADDDSQLECWLCVPRASRFLRAGTTYASLTQKVCWMSLLCLGPCARLLETKGKREKVLADPAIINMPVCVHGHMCRITLFIYLRPAQSLVRPHPALWGSSSQGRSFTRKHSQRSSGSQKTGAKAEEKSCREWQDPASGPWEGGKDDRIILRDLSENPKLPVAESVQFACCLADPSGHRRKHNYICFLI